MHRFSNCSDDFYINLNLNTEMELSGSRETVLHYFELLRKKYKSMRNFYTRERGEYVLEENKDQSAYRWATLERKRLCSGAVNPESVDDAMSQHGFVLGIAPHALSLSPLDCESLNLMFGFDYSFRGNHNQLVAETLGIVPAFEGLLEIPGASAIAYEPSIQIALDEECRVQCRLSVETRTSAYHVRAREFPEEQLSVYVTARRYGSLEPGENYPDVLSRLHDVCMNALDNYVVDQVLVPLQQAIALQ